MKILYVITGLGMGGAETITIDVAQKMLERGHEVAVLYLTGDNLQQHRIKLQMEIIGLHMKGVETSSYICKYVFSKCSACTDVSC